MAYTPIHWQTGDTITAEKLNRCDNGWSVGTSELFSETVTTVDQGGMNRGQLAYSDDITADSITVTFDGTEYACPRIDAFDEYYYGGFSEQGPTFTEYPFVIASANGANTIYTETASTHTVSVTALAIQTSADFDAARGYGYRYAQLFSETVTTVDSGSGVYEGQLSYSQRITADAVTVTYDGTEYTCPSIGVGEYGAPYNEGNPDFSEFPFNLYTESGNSAYLITQTAGEHTIAVSVATVQVSNALKDAVHSFIEAPDAPPFLLVDTLDSATDKTWDEINAVFTTGICIVNGYGPVLQMWYDNATARYYMATGHILSGNGAFDPYIWKTPGSSADLNLSAYKFNSQMP